MLTFSSGYYVLLQSEKVPVTLAGLSLASRIYTMRDGNGNARIPS